MKPILVTCVYNGRSDWLVGGKDNDEGLYIGSLKNLAKLNMPMHLYCWPHMVEQMTEWLKPFWKEFKVIGCDLFEWPRSYEILETKNKFVWHDGKHNDQGPIKALMYAPRNELLCHWKLKWCSMARNNEWGCDKVFWIDAGVSEWCKIPLSLGGGEYRYPHELEQHYPDSHYWPENQNNIFNEKITDGIKRIFEDKEWFFITQDQQNDRLAEFDWPEFGSKTSKIFYELYGWNSGRRAREGSDDKKAFTMSNCVNAPENHWCEYPCWTVGTFFGGSFDELDNVIMPLYMEAFNKFTDDHDIMPFTEEPYYSIICQLHDYNLFWFDNWNHGHENEPCYHGYSKKPFYTTLLDVIDYKSA